MNLADAIEEMGRLRAESERRKHELLHMHRCCQEQTAENERLRDALKEICNMNSGEGGDSCLMQEVADEALGGYEAE